MSQKLLDAAIEFCRQDAILRTLRAEAERCTQYDSGDMTIGDQGIPPCRFAEDEFNPEHACDACKKRHDSIPRYKLAQRRRGYAKKRMIRAAAALDEVGRKR